MVEDKDDRVPPCNLSSKIQIGSFKENVDDLVIELELLNIDDEAQKKVAFFRALDSEGKKIFAKAKGAKCPNLIQIIDDMEKIIKEETGDKTKRLFRIISKTNQQVDEPLPEFWLRLSNMLTSMSFEEKLLVLAGTCQKTAKAKLPWNTICDEMELQLEMQKIEEDKKMLK